MTFVKECFPGIVIVLNEERQLSKLVNTINNGQNSRQHLQGKLWSVDLQ